MKILIVEDDQRIALPVKEHLEHQNYLASLAFDGEQGLELAREQDFDVILLDLMLPRLDGMSLCRTLRQEGCKSAIIMLTARGNTNVKIAGLDSGADDYIVKPFEIDELTARIRAVLRRQGEARTPDLRWKDLVVDPSTCAVTFAGQAVELTPTEYRLLVHFMRNPNRTYTKHELIDRLWTGNELSSGDVIKAHIKGLRNKLASKNAPKDLIMTVHGFGYRLKPDD